MANINLLPKELGNVSKQARLASKLKKASIAASVVLFVLGVGFSGYLFYLSSQLKDVEVASSNLAQNIRSLDETEQTLTFVSDRVKKADTILKSRTVDESVADFNQVFVSIPSGVVINDFKLSKDTVEFGFLVENSLALGQLLSTLVASGIYDQVTMQTLNFTSSKGFLVTFEVI